VELNQCFIMQQRNIDPLGRIVDDQFDVQEDTNSEINCRAGEDIPHQPRVNSVRQDGTPRSGRQSRPY
jgi:hypothetical protein